MTCGVHLGVLSLALVLGSPESTATAAVLVALMACGPLLLATGCLVWEGMLAWLARAAGLVIMLASLVPLVSLAGVLAPFLLLSLPAAWPWKRASPRGLPRG